MFRITDGVFTPAKERVESAVRALPSAHRLAVGEGIAHIHRHVVAAAKDEGLPHHAVIVGWNRGRVHLGVSGGDAGQAVADHELGTETSPPHATLRKAAMRAHPAGQALYETRLREELGW
ncbi:MAG: hypothetical protein KGR26_13440 [Cyanobacteria bacterium REEB65]|nr:hypothetical protein [Cyanobacteria bacterium REEB65]